jgi:hypothetical protein
MVSTLNTNTLLSGLILAIAVGVIVAVAYVVPAWQHSHPKPPNATTHKCGRDLDCDQNLKCMNGLCTEIFPTPKFPWLPVGVTIGIVILGLFLLSAGTVAKTPDAQKQDMSKTLLVRSVFVLIGLLVLTTIGYLVYRARSQRSCPSKPRDSCPAGQINICDENTDYVWTCRDYKDTCGPDPPKCKVGEAECNPETIAWECQNKVCPKAKKVCPKSQDGILYSPRCDAQTGFEWICQPSCSKQPPDSLKCDDGEQPACGPQSQYKYKCEKQGFDVCATAHKPDCEGAICEDTDQGWAWKCPADLSKDDIIRKFGLTYQTYDVWPGQDLGPYCGTCAVKDEAGGSWVGNAAGCCRTCQDVKNHLPDGWYCDPGRYGPPNVYCGDNEQCQPGWNPPPNPTPTEKVTIYFHDGIPVYPTIGADCSNVAQDSVTSSLGKDFNPIINNPKGHISPDNKYFLPYDEKLRVYYQPYNKSEITCPMAIPCWNGGVFQQDKNNISKTGTCKCTGGWSGDKCQTKS